MHSLKGLPHVIDLRNLGLIGAIELEPIAGKPGARGFDMFVRAFEQGLLVRVTGDIIALSPPLIIETAHIDESFGIGSRRSRCASCAVKKSAPEKRPVSLRKPGV